MNNEIKNPEAFPVAIDNQDFATGMSLADYFAAKAMQTIISQWYSSVGWQPERVAKDAYQMAKIMLIEREKFMSHDQQP